MQLQMQPTTIATPPRTPPHPGHGLCRAAAWLAVCAAWLCGAGPAAAAPLDDMRRQVEASQFEQAWGTAQANPQLIGDVHFDFLYGVAAINVGRIAEGLLALERHLAAVPANDRARLELARGYFLLGEYTRARSEFAFVLRYNPPAGVRANIDGFLQAMQVREAADRRASARLYAEAGIGHDSNVNGGTFRNGFQLSFGPFEPLDASKQVSDSFAQVTLGGEQLARVSSRLSVFAGADLDQRSNFQERAYNLTSGNVYVGLTHLSRLALWRLTVGSNELMVGGSRYRDTLSASAEANVTLTPALSMLAFTQYAELRHSAADEVRDLRAVTVGAMFTQTLADAPWAPSFGARLSFTQEHNQRLRRDLERDAPLLRLFGAASPGERWRVAMGLTVYGQKYGGVDLGFQSVRKDTVLIVDALASYAIDNNWSVRGDAFWSASRSNQDLYDSRRRWASLKLRYQY